ncbi:MAG: FAD-dependent oxidoreductase, partial [Chloroflexota bacterium]|nr:FAD-dependent oxidoreductase [Chloroflexota bacterium]
LESIRLPTSIRTYPNGDLNMNPVGLMTGQEAYDLFLAGGPSHAYREAERRARGHWHLLQTHHGMGDWKLSWISPALGVRETHRLVARYVLREQDCRAGVGAQEAAGVADIVAIADHALDFHGTGPWVGRELDGPYGIPLRCLLPRELDNLVVACRGAGFSAVAATSARLSRTMITLGQAAGTTAALFGADVCRADAQTLRAALRADGVSLSPAEGYREAMPGAPVSPSPARSATVAPVAHAP